METTRRISDVEIVCWIVLTLAVFLPGPMLEFVMFGPVTGLAFFL